ncbi:hypothetical protein BJ944DRAFT_238894 [Cunninghamella echinulata]|nr:hypothetical protein BJ944DRAFT_238894 [Cunninghamella echinulata]
MSQALPTYRIPSIEDRSQEKCEEYETLVYNIESCRLSCQIMFNIGTMVFYEEPRLLKANKPNGTFCTSVQYFPSLFSSSSSSSSSTTTTTSEITNSLHGTCQSGICQPNSINNKNNHNEDGSHNNNPGNNVDQSNKIKTHSPSKSTSCFTRTKSHTVNESSTPK